MEPIAYALVAVAAAGVGALILAERAGSRAGMWAAKPLASACFVALGVADGLPSSDAGRWLLAALALSFVGDIFLIPADVRIFRASILSFLLAHVAFVGAFVAEGIAWGWTLAALAPLTLAALVVARWILPRVARPLRAAVIAYVVVITVMVAAAAGAVAAGATPLWILAALAFWTNDILVARDRFVTRSWKNRLYGLPLYYAAMLAFAWTAL